MAPETIVIDADAILIAIAILSVIFLFPLYFIKIVNFIIDSIFDIFITMFMVVNGLINRVKNSQGNILKRLSDTKLLQEHETATLPIHFKFEMYGSGLDLFSALCPELVEKAMQRTWPEVYHRIEELRSQGWQVEFASKETRKRPTSICFNVITYLKIVPPAHLQQKQHSV